MRTTVVQLWFAQSDEFDGAFDEESDLVVVESDFFVDESFVLPASPLEDFAALDRVSFL